MTNVLKVIEQLKANPELKFSDVKCCDDTASFGYIRQCIGDKHVNSIINAIIDEKLDKNEVAKRFFNGRGGRTAARITNIAAQLKTCELINGIPFKKTRVQKIEKRRVREAFKNASMSPLYHAFGTVEEPSTLRGAHLQAAQRYALDLFKVYGAKEMETVSLAGHITELRGKQ